MNSSKFFLLVTVSIASLTLFGCNEPDQQTNAGPTAAEAQVTARQALDAANGAKAAAQNALSTAQQAQAAAAEAKKLAQQNTDRIAAGAQGAAAKSSGGVGGQALIQKGSSTDSTSANTANDSSPSRHRIERIQAALNRAGQDVAIDGYFGSQTRDALEAFQRKNSLDPTGKADAATLEKLNLPQWQPESG